MPSTRVVVTGLGTTSPLGGDVASTWQAMLAGTSGIDYLTDDWAEQLPVKIGGRVAVEPSEVLERVKARRLDRSSQFAMVAADQGNTSAASIPLALDRMIAEGDARSGDTALLIAFGAGLAYAAQVVTVP